MYNAFWADSGWHVKWTRGKRGDIIIVDPRVKRALGTQKHIVVLDDQERVKRFLETLRRLAEIDPGLPEQHIQRCMTIVREAPRVAFARITDCSYTFTVKGARALPEPVRWSDRVKTAQVTYRVSCCDVEEAEKVAVIKPPLREETELWVDEEMLREWLPRLRRIWREVKQRYSWLPDAAIRALVRAAAMAEGLPEDYAFLRQLPVKARTRYIVDREALLRDEVTRILAEEGYTIRVAEPPREEEYVPYIECPLNAEEFYRRAAGLDPRLREWMYYLWRPAVKDIVPSYVY